MSRVRIERGRYNFARPDEYQYQLCVMLPDKKWITALFDEDEWCGAGLLAPSEALEMISENLARTNWSDKAERLARIEAAMPFVEEMDRDWAIDQIDDLERQITNRRALQDSFRKRYLQEEGEKANAKSEWISHECKSPTSDEGEDKH